MPGPHGFAVRFSAARLRAGASLTRFSSPCNCHWRARRYRVHRISHPTSVTIAIRPSCGHETAETSGGDLPDGTSEIFLRRGLDDPNHVDPVQQISALLQLRRCKSGVATSPPSSAQVTCPGHQITKNPWV